MDDHRAWGSKSRPERILVIRLQALGDVIITLPYISALKKILPGARIDLLTRNEVAGIPGRLPCIDRVIAIGGGRNRRLHYLTAAARLPTLLSARYDVVADLQNSSLSQLILKTIRPRAWCSFDRFSGLPAGIRTRNTLQQLGLGRIIADFDLKSCDHERSTDRLRRAGWSPEDPLVVLNPAGFHESRNWPVQNYLEFANRWLSEYRPDTRFLVIGVDRISDKAEYLASNLKDRCINLVNQTTPAEAFSLVGHAGLVLSEDSGLMHMAWVAGIPTVALFGSSRGDWSRPLGQHSVCLDSSDLPCGYCMLENCKFGDTRCLTRHSPADVVEVSLKLLRSLGRSQSNNCL